MREKLKEHLSRRTVVRAGGHLGVAGTLALLMSPAWSGSRTHAAATAALLPHHSEDVIWKQVSEIFGGTGVIVLGNVLMIKIPRSDLHGTLFGTPIRSALALFALFHFQHVGTQAIVKYEFTLLEHEVSVFLDTLFAQNLQPATSVLGAQHNHFLGLDPRVIHTHGTSVGDPVQIALALRRVLARTGSPLEEVVRSSDGLGFDPAPIEQIIGGKGEGRDGVFSITVPRLERFHELDIELAPSLQIGSLFAFQSIGNGQVAEVTDFAVIPQEADTVVRILRFSGHMNTALHNHELFLQPMLFYVHSFAIGSPVELARVTRHALNQTRSRPASPA